MDITRRSAGVLAMEMRAGSLRCVEVMEAFADRIERFNSRVNAIIQLDIPKALEAAAVADKARDAGEATGPLFGLPFAVKDNYDVVGFRTTYGAPALRNNWPDTDSLHIARMKAAGAIVVGKTNMPEFAFGEDTENPLWGRTRNPYCLNRTAGSSSGGSGAALALDLVALADGSDLGGSTRIPASWCNIVGYRPTTGVVPKVPSVAPFDRLHVMGPMARRVDDIRLTLSVICGRDVRSPITAPFGPEEFAAPLTGNLAGIRIAFSVGNKTFRIDPSVTEALSPCSDILSRAGAKVTDAAPDISFLARSQPVYRALCASEYAGWAVDEYGLELGHVILDLVGQSRRFTGYEIERANMMRVKAWQKMASFFDSYDLVCWPTSSGSPFAPDMPGLKDFDWDTVYISPALDLPSVSVPGGFTRDGLPTGLHILGPPGSDRLVLEAAEAIERGLQMWERNPPNETLTLAATR
ncbi:MAG: amidase [Alphaproteobacteria bacterium]|nr:amidase [Alphaproteobacteria bacterium]